MKPRTSFDTDVPFTCEVWIGGPAGTGNCPP